MSWSPRHSLMRFQGKGKRKSLKSKREKRTPARLQVAVAPAGEERRPAEARALLLEPHGTPGARDADSALQGTGRCDARRPATQAAPSRRGCHRQGTPGQPRSQRAQPSGGTRTPSWRPPSRLWPGVGGERWPECGRQGELVPQAPEARAQAQGTAGRD